MKRLPLLLVLLSLLAPSAVRAAELRGAVRAGAFTSGGNDLAGAVELDARLGAWSLAPAYEVIRGGYDLHAVHVDVRRLFAAGSRTFWLGAGPTFVSTSESSTTTWNADAGLAWRTGKAWEPFVAARYFSFKTPVFRDRVEEHGAVLSAGISVRFH